MFQTMGAPPAPHTALKSVRTGVVDVWTTIGEKEEEILVQTKKKDGKWGSILLSSSERKQTINSLSLFHSSEWDRKSIRPLHRRRLFVNIIIIIFAVFILFIHHNQKPGTFCKIKLIKITNGLYSISSWRLLVRLYFWTFTKTKTKHHLVFRFTCTENCTFSLWPFSQFW